MEVKALDLEWTRRQGFDLLGHASGVTPLVTRPCRFDSSTSKAG